MKRLCSARKKNLTSCIPLPTSSLVTEPAEGQATSLLFLLLHILHELLELYGFATTNFGR